METIEHERMKFTSSCFIPTLQLKLNGKYTNAVRYAAQIRTVKEIHIILKQI